MCLVWFVHNILWVRYINNNISLGLINLSEDLEAFNNYPWGYEIFKMTVQYLLTPLTPKTVNLYGFPWAFMVNISFIMIWFIIFLFNNAFDLLALCYRLGHLKSFLIWDNKWTTRKEFPIQESWDDCQSKLIKMQNFLIFSTLRRKQ